MWFVTYNEKVALYTSLAYTVIWYLRIKKGFEISGLYKNGTAAGVFIQIWVYSKISHIMNTAIQVTVLRTSKRALHQHITSYKGDVSI